MKFLVYKRFFIENPRPCRVMFSGQTFHHRGKIHMETTMIVLNSSMILVGQLGVTLDPRNLWTLCAMIALLLKGTPLHVYDLARALPSPGQLASRVPKLRRWISHPTICPAMFVEGWIALLAPVLSQMPHITLILDRTDWTKRGVHLNILFCSLAFFGRSFPVYWTLLPHGGCSTLAQQQAVLEPVLAAILAHPRLACLPRKACADREFGSPLLADWLTEHWQCPSALRIKRSVLVSRTDIPSTPVRAFFAHMERGQYYFFEHVMLTDTYRYDANLLLYWREDCDEPLAVMTTLSEAETASDTYRERPFIETLHRDIKSGGYDIEGSRVTDTTRVTNLLIPAAFAYMLTLLQGRLEELRDPCPPLKGREFSLFSQGQHRFTDLIGRHPVPTVYHFVLQFIHFLVALLQQPPAEDCLRSFTLFAQQQLLLL
jgi:hypothetical protein